MSLLKTDANRYTLYGALFGSCFPVIATLLRSFSVEAMPFGESILHVQKTDSLVWIIDSAPLFLGLFARFAGIRQDKINKYAAELEGIVEERTQELKESHQEQKLMLENLSQGLLMVLGDGTIHPEYSAKTPAILNKSNIAGLDIHELFCHQSLLNLEQKSQFKEALNCCLGADELQYDLNCDALPSEIALKQNDSLSFLELQWIPIYRNDEVARLLLTLRDVTEVKELQDQMEKQRIELLVLEKMLLVSPQDFDLFVKNSLERVKHVRDILKQSQITNDELNEVFRDLHTLKGNSRILGFSDVSAAVHDAEDPIQEMRRTSLSHDLVDLVLKRLLRVQDVVNRLNEQYYSRFKNFLTGLGGLQKLLPKKRLESLLNNLVQNQSIDSQKANSWLHSLQEAYQNEAISFTDLAEIPTLETEVSDPIEQLKAVSKSYFVSVKDLFCEQVHLSENIALSLSKEIPKAQVFTQELLLKQEFAISLKEAFGHLIRNSIDHGLELAEERVEALKSPFGNLKLELNFEEKDLGTELPILIYSDDGRGLNIDKIKEKLEKSGVSCENRSLSWFAQQIFTPGFSSKDDVSEISGRGVGMDAVLHLLEKINADIVLDVGDYSAPYLPIRFKIYLPRLSSLIFN